MRDRLDLDPTGRPAKSTSSVIDKLRRETIRLSQMQDIAGCRIVVADTKEQDVVVARLTQAFDAVTIADRRAAPSHGYRAVHVVVAIEGISVEIQVRTQLQHIWAELSEKLSDVVDPSIKYGGGDTEPRGMLNNISSLIARIERLEEEAPTAASANNLAAFRSEVYSSLQSIIRGLAGNVGGDDVIPN